jgi:hypothetical protein
METLQKHQTHFGGTEELMSTDHKVGLQKEMDFPRSQRAEADFPS